MACYKWTDWKAKRLEEGRGQRPNYSFDSFLKRSQELGDEISSFVGDAKRKDVELDKEKKSPPSENEKDEDEDEAKQEKRKAWDTLRKVARERDQEAAEKEAKKPSGSATKSTKQPRSTSK
jgi:hypothetical protein